MTEAVQLAEFEVQQASDLADIINGKNAMALVLDEGAADKKTLSLWQNRSEKEKSRIFLLGHPDEAWNKGSDVEVFAKPLRLGHLLARLSFYKHAVSRVQKPAVFGAYRLDIHSRQLFHDKGDAIRLTEKETALLDYLLQSDAPVSREELLAGVWGYDAQIDTHTLETHIYQLRRKLDPGGQGVNILVNEEGCYRLR